MVFQFPCNLERAQNRRFRRSAKYQRSAIACWQPQQLPFCFGHPELLRAAHNLFQSIKLLALLSDEQLRVGDNVNEQDMADSSAAGRIR